MTYYTPCRNCTHSKAGCEIKDAKRKAFKGHGITSVNFRCDARKPLFEPGQRVLLTWRVWGEPDVYGDTEESTHQFKATVMREFKNGFKFILRVDDAKSIDGECDPSAAFGNDPPIIKARTSCISPIDEPRRDFCGACFGFPGEDRCQGWGDLKSWDSYWPSECPKRPDAKAGSEAVL